MLVSTNVWGDVPTCHQKQQVFFVATKTAGNYPKVCLRHPHSGEKKPTAMETPILFKWHVLWLLGLCALTAERMKPNLAQKCLCNFLFKATDKYLYIEWMVEIDARFCHCSTATFNLNINDSSVQMVTWGHTRCQCEDLTTVLLQGSWGEERE